MKYLILLLMLVMLAGCATTLTVSTTEGPGAKCDAKFSQPWYGSASSINAEACGATWGAQDIDPNTQALNSLLGIVK